MAYGSFEDREVWKRACGLAVQVYEVLHECRDDRLKDQMTRAAISIASNSAEGAKKDSKAEYVRFLHIAKGSAAELGTQMYIPHRIGITRKEPTQTMTIELKEISKCSTP